MPGIVGLITKAPGHEAVPQLERMMQALIHERFYALGTWSDPSIGVYIGWVTHKGSFCDGMPLRNEDGDIVLVFSGEEFPEPGTAEILKSRGHDVHCVGPSYLVHLYEEDSSFPVRLNGRFHGLVADKQQGTTLLFNDRYGMHRIYYHEAKDGFYFACEAKAILAVRPELRRIEAKGLGEFIACGSVLENRTLFERVHLLPAGSAWIFRNGSLRHKGSYFSPREWEQQEVFRDPEAYYKGLRDIFSRNLARYFDGRDRIAMSLTGGLDTRMIMAWQRPEPGSLPCYTFGSVLRDCRDVIVARQVARACGQRHQVIRVGPEFLSQFSHYAERAVYLTDGCTDVGRAPDLYLNELAREIAPVRMTGNYGGEVLRGVRTFKPDESVPGLYVPELLCHVRAARTAYADLLGGHPVSFAVFEQAPCHHYGILALEQTQLTMRSPFLDNDFVRTVFRAPRSTLSNTQVSARLIGDGNPILQRIPTDRGPCGGTPGRGISQLASRLFLEFSFKAEYAYDIGMPQWMAAIDHALAPMHLDRLVLGRHKIFHFRTWYRDALAGYLRDVLLDSRSLSRPYIQRKAVQALILGHLAGYRNRTSEIHRLLTLELLHRLFTDASSQ